MYLTNSGSHLHIFEDARHNGLSSDTVQLPPTPVNSRWRPINRKYMPLWQLRCGTTYSRNSNGCFHICGDARSNRPSGDTVRLPPTPENSRWRTWRPPNRKYEQLWFGSWYLRNSKGQFPIFEDAGPNGPSGDTIRLPPTPEMHALPVYMAPS